MKGDESSNVLNWQEYNEPLVKRMMIHVIFHLPSRQLEVFLKKALRADS